MAEIKKGKGGVYVVGFDTMHGKKWRSTKTRTLEAARRVVAEAKIADLEMAAKAKALTYESLSAIMAGRRVTCAIALAEWKDYMQARQRSQNTLASYANCLDRFLAWGKLLDKPVTRITDELINGWINLPDAGSRSNRLHKLSAIRSFFDLCTSRAYCIGDPSNLAEVNHRIMSGEEKESTPRQPFTEAEYRKLVGNTEGFWNWAVQIGWWTGLRLSDICTLEWSAFVDGDIIVHTIKRDRRVQIPMSHPAIGGGILNLVLLEMAENRTSSRFCFPDAAEAIMDVNRRSKFSVAFMRLLNRLDIYGRSFHCLRHSFVTRLAAEGIELEEIGKLVGHARSDTTLGYNHLPAAKKAKARRGLVVAHA